MNADYFCNALLPDLGVTLVKDTLQVSGGFIIQTLLRRALQNGDKVILVTLEQSLEKYKYCLKKLGVNLQQYIDSKQLSVVGTSELGLSGPVLADDATGILKTLYNLVLDGVSTAGVPDNTTTSQQGNSGGTGMPVGPSTETHNGQLQQPTSGGVTVLMDNVSVWCGIHAAGMPLTVSVTGLCWHLLKSRGAMKVLAALRCDSVDWTAFLHRCSAVGRHAQGKACACIMLAHGDVPDDEPWIKGLQHLAEVVIDIVPLEARMANIDGTVTITRRKLPGSCSQQGQQQAGVTGLVQRDEPFEAVRSLYFRAGETGAKWIPQVALSDLL